MSLVSRKVLASLFGVVLIGAAVAVTLTGGGASGAQPPVLISGAVTDGSGNPLAGVTVVANLEPAPDSNGDIIPVAVASTTTDMSGNYSLPTSLTSQIIAAQDANGGYANFELDVTDTAHGLTTSWGFSAGLITPVSGTQEWNDPATSAQPTRDVDLSPGSPLVLKVSPTVAARLARPAGAQFGSVQPHGASPPCREADVSDLGTKPVVVGEVHSWTGQHDEFTYGTSADSSIQYGITGSDGDYHVGGSVHVGNSSSRGTAGSTGISGRHPHGRRVIAIFDFHQFLNTCSHQKEKRAVGWNGLDVGLGAQTTQDEDGQCSKSPHFHTFLPGQHTFTRNDSQATWFSAAVTLGPLSLESQSGFSKNVTSVWSFTRTGSRMLCGSDATPYTAKRVFAGA